MNFLPHILFALGFIGAINAFILAFYFIFTKKYAQPSSRYFGLKKKQKQNRIGRICAEIPTNRIRLISARRVAIFGSEKKQNRSTQKYSGVSLSANWAREK